jgi:hypothetical protein
VSSGLSALFPEEVRDPTKNNRKENNRTRVRRKSPTPIHMRIRNLRICGRPHRSVPDRLVQIGTILFRLRPRRMHAQNQKPNNHQGESDVVEAIHRDPKYYISSPIMKAPAENIWCPADLCPCRFAERTLVMFARIILPQ